MDLLNEAEMGERTIERLVFSGHSVGSGVWGDENGIEMAPSKKTMDIFPKASGQVEDVLLAACYSGGQNTMKTYRGLFPNLKTIWRMMVLRPVHIAVHTPYHAVGTRYGGQYRRCA